jgi:hypothetical protein
MQRMGTPSDAANAAEYLAGGSGGVCEWAEELQVRNMTYDLCRSLLGGDHLACIMARYQPWAVFPELNLYQNNNNGNTNSINSFEESFEIIKNFDKTTQSYIH